MSVWSDPCYSIEALRNTVNNLPTSDHKSFPDYLDGIANFHFGNCTTRHADRANKTAKEYFGSNPKEWTKFCRSGRSRGTESEKNAFRNTILQTNVKYGGIRAVYWAFSKVVTKKWSAPVTYDKEQAKDYVRTTCKLQAPTSRINQASWDEAIKWYGEEERYDWLQEDSAADSFKFLWFKRRAKRSRDIRNKRTIIIKKAIRSSAVRVKNGQIIYDEETKRVRSFDVEAARIAYKEVARKVRSKEKVTQGELKKVSTLPFHDLPRKGGRLIIFPFTGGLIMYDKVEQAAAVMFQKDYDRFVQMLQAHAQLTLYYSKYSLEDKALSAEMVDKYYQILNTFLNDFDFTDDKRCNKVCRAYDVGQFIILASLASDINTVAIDEQIDKMEREELNDVVDLSEALRVMQSGRIGVKESLELAKFNKIFPCPDFCIYSVVDNLENKRDNPHPSSDTVDITTSIGTNYTASRAEWRIYMLRNRAITYHSMHGIFPGTLIQELVDDPESDIPVRLLNYPHLTIDALSVDDMKYIDFKGTFDYRRYHMCEDELVKDKTIAPTIYKNTESKVKDHSLIERNQVLKYLFSKEFKQQSVINKMFETGSIFKIYKQWILLALKPEAKKPDSRAFSMATDEVRRELSEYESNVARYVEHQKGSSQAKSDKDLSERLSELSKYEVPKDGEETFMMSFDIEGFSPKQARSFKEDGFSSWEYAFDLPDVYNIKRIFTDTSLHFEKFGISDSMAMNGNDLEGFVGRQNTATHIDLMGYAVYVLKQLKIVTKPPALEVLIDDGLLKMRVKTGHIEEAISIIEMVYEMAGLKISWDKTFCSQIMCQYLNKVYYDGIEITPGAKAFIRIGKPQEMAVPTLADELEANAASTRGAIQNGSDHRLCYFSYVHCNYKTLRRWGLKTMDDSALYRMAFMSYVPVGLGGFGFSTIFGLATNEAYNSMNAGIANMKMICHSFRSYAPLANKILNAGVRSMDEESILRNPHAMRTKLRCLNTRRFANAAKSYIMNNSVNTLIRAVAQGDFEGADENMLAYIANNHTIDEIVRTRFWKMSTKCFVEKIVSKLQTSRTAASVLGNKRCQSIFMVNRSESRQLILEICAGAYTIRG